MPEYRRQGVARTLLKALTGLPEELSLPVIFYGTEEELNREFLSGVGFCEQESDLICLEGSLREYRKLPMPKNNLQYELLSAEREADEKLYAVTVDYLTDGIRNYGFQILLRDDTKNQKYIQLLGTYNTDLQKEVDSKTQRIIDMHDSLIMGMATMVESRDNSTGGHIRRTSEGVRLLLKEMKIYDSMNLSDSFCKNLIKAAPMHDLGKIAVDDAILRKAGPLTPEERQKMKRHSAEGARIVHEILKETDDVEFRRIAENVAHYHHERVDGKGYPDGLSGRAIPLEARIMAIADSYDALVSRRGYKEPFSFEKANEIILDGMGTQFDEDLRWYYERARPKLEAYYSMQDDVRG